MKYVLFLGLLLTVATLFGCAEEGDGNLETTATGTDNTLVGTTTTVDGECQPGFQRGRCPNDIALPNADGDLVSLHSLRGSRVAVIGAAEF
jgi:hypothetical protein